MYNTKRCMMCNSYNTYVWYERPDGYLCQICHAKELREQRSKELRELKARG
jgi:hypothetical protein